jgi:hypothetical protein
MEEKKYRLHIYSQFYAFKKSMFIDPRLISAYVDRMYGLKFTREVYNLIKDILNLNRTEDTVVDR